MSSPTTSKTVLAEVTIRKACADDAEKVNALLMELADEPDIFFAFTRDEADVPVDKQRESIESLDTNNSVYFVAEVQGDDSRLIGELSCRGDKWKSLQHVTALGMSIRREWRNKGLGQAMLREAIEWARTNKLERIELEVYALNEPAIHIYKKFGFEIEGCKRRYVFHRGEYFALLMMALLL